MIDKSMIIMYLYTQIGYMFIQNKIRRNIMNEFIEKNRALLYSYHIGTRIIGWLLLIGAVVVPIVQPLSGLSANNEHRSFWIYARFEQIILGYLLLGLVLLVLAQFVRYLYEGEYRPGIILRHGVMVLYIYAAALIASSFLTFYFRMREFGYAGIGNLFEYLLGMNLPDIAKALIFIGIAKVLKRMMPMLEESKTLV